MPSRDPQSARQRQFAEEVGLMGERSGMPRMVARLLGWLLICDPPNQSSAEIANALGVSRASVSIATRLLEAGGLIRRTAAPGMRSHRFEIVPSAFMDLTAAERFREWREIAERGLSLLDDPEGERGARLRATRAFYAFVEREVPKLIERFRAEHQGGTPAQESPT
jgi:DNA-binding transcriptional regulator GbsR (MarR family)